MTLPQGTSYLLWDTEPMGVRAGLGPGLSRGGSRGSWARSADAQGMGVHVCTCVCTHMCASLGRAQECPSERGSSELWDGQSPGFPGPLGGAPHHGRGEHPVLSPSPHPPLPL